MVVRRIKQIWTKTQSQSQRKYVFVNRQLQLNNATKSAVPGPPGPAAKTVIQESWRPLCSAFLETRSNENKGKNRNGNTNIKRK